MGFKIQNNIASLGGLRNLEKNQEMMSKLVERLSSGRKINQADDDAAGLAASMRMRAEIGSLNTAVRNTMEAGSTLQVADGGLAQSEEILIRMKELATQAASSTAGGDRSAIQAEMSALQSELDRIAGSTSYGEQPLLDGSYNGEFQIGDSSEPGNQLGFSLADVSTASLNGGAALNVSVGDAQSAQQALSDIDNALDYLADQRSAVGALSNRIDAQQSNLLVAIENKIAAESTIADADMAAEMVDFTKTQILLQADTAMLAQANAVSQFPINLLK